MSKRGCLVGATCFTISSKMVSASEASALSSMQMGFRVITSRNLSESTLGSAAARLTNSTTGAKSGPRSLSPLGVAAGAASLRPRACSS